MRIHKEGRKSIQIALIITICLLFIALTFLSNILILAWLLSLFALFVFFFTLYFFRIPNRDLVVDDNKIIAPADGTVVVIEKVQVDEYLTDEMMQVSIFMSPFNVHRNLFPINGTVDYYKYHPGKFLVAYNPKSSTLNERTTTVVSNSKGSVLARQIAGGFARRIISYAKAGQKAKQGEELGFIKFGSRVDLFFPLNAEIKVKKGQKTKGGITEIARW